MGLKQSIFVLLLVAFSMQRGKSQSSLLWRIECDSCPKPSYLFGTNHTIHGHYITEHSLLKNIAFTVDAIATESAPATYKQTYASNDSFHSGVQLHYLLDSADYKVVTDSFRKYFNLPFDSVEYMNPIALERSFRYARHIWDLYKRKGAAVEDSIYPVPMDESFKKIAIGRNIPLTALDEPGALSKMKKEEIPLEEQAQMLMIGLLFPKGDRLWLTQDSCYRANDINCLCRTEKDSSGNAHAGYSVLLYKRSLLWMEKIPLLINKQSVFIAVGAMHLCGENGLVNLLKSKGYILTPLRHE